MPLPLLPLPLPLLLLPLAQAEVRITTEDVSTWAVVEPFSFGRLRVLKYMSTTKPTPLLLLLLLLRLLATAARRIEVLPDTCMYRYMISHQNTCCIGCRRPRLIIQAQPYVALPHQFTTATFISTCSNRRVNSITAVPHGTRVGYKLPRYQV